METLFPFFQWTNLLIIPGLLIGYTIHELGHALTAYWLGDTSQADRGGITLNPFKHISWFGFIFFVIFGLGWPKPMRANPANFKRGYLDLCVVALAGPFTNLTLGALAGAFGPFVDLRTGAASGRGVVVYWPGLEIGATTGALWARVLFAFALVNLALAVFNMLPIPPLDGSRLVPLALPPRGRETFSRLAPYGFVAIFLLVVAFPGALSFIGDAIGWLLRVVV